LKLERGRDILINVIDKYLKAEKRENSYDLAHFEERWQVTRGLISRWRSGAKRIGRDKARVVFESIRERWPTWTVERYDDEWPHIHDRFLLRKRKLDAWEASAPPDATPPCGNCGDSANRHNAHGECRDCILGCTDYEAWVRRGRRAPRGSKLHKLTA
jgi:hypothetical protein